MKQKKLIAALLAIAMLIAVVPATAAAEDTAVANGTCGDSLAWVLDSEGTLTISGEGEIWDYPDEYPGWYDYADQVTNVVIEDGVTRIGDYTFYQCGNITTVSIPDSVTELGDKTFTWCSSLQSIVIPDSVTSIGSHTFQNCTSLTEVKLSSNLATIPQWTFGYCPIKSVEIPASVHTIERSAFAYCSLDSIKFTESVPSINSNAFNSATATAYYPAGNETWTEDVMQNYGGTITWVAYEAEEDDRVFIETDTEMSVTISTGGEIAYLYFTPECTDFYAFLSTGSMDTYGYLYDSEMNLLTSNNNGGGKKNFSIMYRLEAGVTYIFGVKYNSDTDVGTISLKLLTTHSYQRTVNKESTCIEEGEMLCTCIYCGYSYTEVIPQSDHTWGDDDLCTVCGEEWSVSGECGSDLTWILTADGTLTISGEGTMFDFDPGIPGWYYYGDRIQKVVIEEGATSIGVYAFTDYPNLVSAELPSSLTKFGFGAFMNCSSLASLVIPAAVETIDRCAFEGCTGLQQIHFTGDAPSIGDNAFNGVTVTAYYPAGNETWTEDVMQDYGGTVTWIAEDLIVEDPCANGHSYGAWYSVTDTEDRRDCANCDHYQTRTNSFTDTNKTKYYYEPVMWAVENNVTAGRTETHFGVGETCTREQIVTFLWRAMGEPEPTATVSPFTDVQNSNSYYYKAVLWAVENNITSGKTATYFGVGTECTRAQIVTFLWRAMGEQEPINTVSSFPDVQNSNAYYYKAVLWAVENGITSGRTDGTFDVDGACTREQAVTFLYRALNDE